MAHNFFLLFCIVLTLLPSLKPLPFGKNVLEPLLGSSYKKLVDLEDEESETLLPTNSFTDFQARRPKANRGTVKSILKTTSGKFRTIFISQGHTSESKVLTSWEVCYDISKKASGPSQSPEVREMATAVLNIGPHLGLRQNDPKGKHLKYTIDLFCLSLEIDSLSTAERLWAVGVLSYLRSQIPEYRDLAIPRFWTAKDLGKPRGDFLFFFLKDKDLGKAIWDLWSESSFEADASTEAIQEAIRRESIVYLIRSEMGVARHHPSAHFQDIYLRFINLETPIDSKKASALMKWIEDRLNHSTNLKRIGFDEEANIIRLLLHLEEYHYPSYRQFTGLTNTEERREKILQNDIAFQISDKNLPTDVISLLEEFQSAKNVNEQHIPKILDILNEEQMSIHQLGRFFRVLTLSFAGNHQMYKSLKFQLSQNYKMVPRLFKRLSKYRHGQMNPAQFEWGALEYLVFLKNEDQVMEKYRNKLADHLLSKGVLLEAEIPRDLQWMPPETKRLIVDLMLYEIFNNMARVGSFNQNPDTDDKLVEYIFHLISFKNDDRYLYRHLLAPKGDPEKFSIHHTVGFRALSELLYHFLNHRSWNTHGQLDEFRQALIKLEDTIFSSQHKNPRSPLYKYNPV